MDALITHLVSPFLKHPQDCAHQVISQKATLIVELLLHEEDKENFTDEQRFSVQHVLSLASGNKKPVIEIVNEFSDPRTGEESEGTEITEESEESSESGKTSDSSEESSESSAE